MSDLPSGQIRPDRARRELTVPLPQLPKAFWAFHNQYYKPYRRYAHVHLGDEHAAGELVHQVFMHLALNWAHLMEEGCPDWALSTGSTVSNSTAVSVT